MVKPLLVKSFDFQFYPCKTRYTTGYTTGTTKTLNTQKKKKKKKKIHGVAQSHTGKETEARGDSRVYCRHPFLTFSGDTAAETEGPDVSLRGCGLWLWRHAEG
jgi:hypothetical protein